MVFKPTPLELTEFVNEFLRCGGDEGGRIPLILSLPLPISQSVGISGVEIPKDWMKYLLVVV